MKFKVGDKVRFVGDKDSTPEKKSCYGKTNKIMSCMSWGGYPYLVEDGEGDSFVWRDTELVLVEDSKIVITTDGVTTLARLYEDGKVTKSAEAKCSPEDTFDFKVGANIAFNRLIGKPVGELTSEGKHEYKPGDKVKVVKNTCFHYSKIGDVITLTDRIFESEWHYKENVGFITEEDIEPYVELEKKNLKFNTGDYAKVVDNVMHHGLKIGTIVKLTKDNDCYIAVAEGSPIEWYVCDDELEPYTKPKYYNGKVVCVDLCGHNLDDYTVGKVYEFKDGIITTDRGLTFGGIPGERFYTFNDWSKWTSSKFIPLVED